MREYVLQVLVTGVENRVIRKSIVLVLWKIGRYILIQDLNIAFEFKEYCIAVFTLRFIKMYLYLTLFLSLSLSNTHTHTYFGRSDGKVVPYESRCQG